MSQAVNKVSVCIALVVVFIAQQAFAFVQGTSSQITQSLTNIGKVPVSTPSHEAWWANAKKITTCEQFQEVRHNLAGDYLVANNIDCQGITMLPIGSEQNPFTGRIGAEKVFTISNITIDNPTWQFENIFNKSATASISNVVFDNVKLKNNTFSLNTIVSGRGQLYEERFGSAIAIDKQTMAIGAPLANNFFGAVEIFKWQDNQWVYSATVSPIAPVQRSDFGLRVQLKENLLFVSAYLGGGDNVYYVFELVAGQWKQKTMISVSPGSQLTFAGSDLVFVSPKSIDIYTKKDGGWVLKQTIGAASLLGDQQENLYFLASAAASPEVIVVGATPYSHFDKDEGYIYIFRQVNGQWALSTRISNQQPGFGSGVVLEGDNLVVRSDANVLSGSVNNLLRDGLKPVLTNEALEGFIVGQTMVLHQGILVVSLIPPAINPGSVVKKESVVVLQQREDNRWSKINTLTPLDITPAWINGSLVLSGFGVAIGISDDRHVLVGSPLLKSNFSKPESVFEYVLQAPIDLPDLTVKKIWIESSTVLSNTASVVKVNVANVGKIATHRPVTVKITVIEQTGADAVVDTQSKNLTSLGVLQEEQIDFTVFLPRAGLYQISAVIDEENVLKEQDESNNRAATSVMANISDNELNSIVERVFVENSQVVSYKDLIRGAIVNIIDTDATIDQTMQSFVKSSVTTVLNDSATAGSLNNFVEWVAISSESDAEFLGVYQSVVDELTTMIINDPSLADDPVRLNRATANAFLARQSQVERIFTRIIKTHPNVQSPKTQFKSNFMQGLVLHKAEFLPGVNNVLATISQRVKFSSSVENYKNSLRFVVAEQVRLQVKPPADDQRIFAITDKLIDAYIQTTIDFDETVQDFQNFYRGIISDDDYNDMLVGVVMASFYSEFGVSPNVGVAIQAKVATQAVHQPTAMALPTAKVNVRFNTITRITTKLIKAPVKKVTVLSVKRATTKRFTRAGLKPNLALIKMRGIKNLTSDQIKLYLP